MKYNNIAGRMRFAYVFITIVGVLIIPLVWITNESFIDNIFITITFILMIIMYTWMIFSLKYLFYNTYVLKDGIKQTFLRDKKEISFSDIKVIYFIDDLVIFANSREVNIEDCKYTMMQKKKIKKRLENNVVVQINLSNKYFSIILADKCNHAEIIKVGKISKYIEEEFDI